jgi:hypothetical protein
MFSPSYNRGEWAELYVLAKVLCDQFLKVRVHGDNSTVKLLTVKQIKRGPEPTDESYSIQGEYIVCDHTSKRVLREEICKCIPHFLQQIKRGKGSFTLAAGDEVLKMLDISQLKKGSGRKSDIFIDVIDPLTGATGVQGYTIKALLGSTPSLFNASVPTNFTFKIDPQLTPTEINEYNRRNSEGKLVHGIRDTVAKLLETQHAITLKSMDRRFRDNLELLDTRMPDFIAEALMAYYGRRIGKATSVKKTVEYLCASNPLGVNNPTAWYSHKVKDFLEASAYGMVPTEPFNGERTAAGGLLLVEKNGELNCFRLDDKDKSRDYLIEHTYFETAARDKHHFGELSNVGTDTHLKLNLQVRYK